MPLPAPPASCSNSPDATAPEVADDVYRHLLHALPEAFVAIDGTRHVTEWSPRAVDIFGWTLAEVSGRTAEQLGLPEAYQASCLPELPVFIRRVSRPDARNGPQHLAINSACQEFPVEFSLSKAIASSSNGSRYFLLIKDISHRLLVKERFAQAVKMEAIGQLTSGLAHDFNNALGIIHGSLEMLATRLTDPIDRELVELAIAATERGTETTRSMQAVARRQPVQQEAANINAILLNLRPLLENSAGKDVELVLLPEAAAAEVLIDIGALNNVLLNFVINARDAMPSGGIVLIYTQNIAIADDPLDAVDLEPGGYVVLGVDDTGSGMPREIAARAMEPFFTTKPKGKGSGLGLAMAYAFARQSGGALRIRSTPGKGTNIHLFIPTTSSTGV